MKTRPHKVEIDRIVLEGVNVGPGRAESIRAAVEANLEHLLEGRRMLDGPVSGNADILEAPARDVNANQSESRLAMDLARSIAAAVGERK